FAVNSGFPLSRCPDILVTRCFVPFVVLLFRCRAMPAISCVDGGYSPGSPRKQKTYRSSPRSARTARCWPTGVASRSARPFLCLLRSSALQRILGLPFRPRRFDYGAECRWLSAECFCFQCSPVPACRGSAVRFLFASLASFSWFSSAPPRLRGRFCFCLSGHGHSGGGSGMGRPSQHSTTTKRLSSR